MKIILVSEKKDWKDNEYSLEFGLHDGKKHFDHHGAFGTNKAPCNNPEIKAIPKDSIIYVNHLDVDNLLGIFRMMGLQIPSFISTNQVEKVDINGTYGLSNEERDNQTSAYYVGVGCFLRKMKTPRVSNDPFDVTKIVKEFIQSDISVIIFNGKKSIKKMREDFNDCIVTKKGKFLLLNSIAGKALNVSLAYDLGFEKIVVYRSNYRTVSLYAKPDMDIDFTRKEIAGIVFAGHPKACGSPREKEYTLDDAAKVFERICDADATV